MPRALQQITTVAIFALLPFPLLAADDDARLTMTGSARLVIEPDIIRGHGGIYVEDEIAASALETAKKRLADLRTALEAFGEVRVSRIVTEQNRSKGSRLIRSDDPGFSAQGTVVVTLADPEKSGEVLDAFVKAGADGISRLEYDTTRRAELLTEAREKAVADAIERAETYARAASLSLGEILELSEVYADHGMPHHDRSSYGASVYGAKGVAGPEPLSVGATVTIRWEIR